MDAHMDCFRRREAAARAGEADGPADERDRPDPAPEGPRARTRR